MYKWYACLVWLLASPVLCVSTTLSNIVRQNDNIRQCPILFHAQPPRQSLARTSVLNSTTESVHVLSGMPANPELLKMIVHVFNSETDGDSESFECTGVLVTENLVLASKACKISEESSFVYVGAKSKNDFAEKYTISEIKEYPTDGSAVPPFVGFYGIELTESVPDAKTMKVNVNPSIPRDGGSLRIVGAGSFESGETENPNNDVYQVDTAFISRDVCNEKYKAEGADELKDNHFCVGNLGNSVCRPCNGDGPVIQYDEAEEPVLVGMSAGFPLSCEKAEFFSIISRVGPIANELSSDIKISRATDTICIKPDGSGNLCSPGAVIGAIAGGAIGAVVLITAAACLFYFCVIKPKSSSGPSKLAEIQEVDTSSLKPVVLIPDNSPQLTSGPISSSSFPPPSSDKQNLNDGFSLGPSADTLAPNQPLNSQLEYQSSVAPVTAAGAQPATPITPLAVNTYNPYSGNRGVESPNNYQQ